jgi:hypothetical protein
MPGRYKSTATVALTNYDLDFSPAKDIFPYWYSPDCYPEMYTFLPCDVATVGTAAPPWAHCGVNNLSVPIDSSTGQWSSSGSSPFIQSGGFCFSEALQSIEHDGMQDSKTSSTQHTSLGTIKPQAADLLLACTSKMVQLSPSALKADPYSSDNTGSESSMEPAPRKRRRPRINRDDISASSTLVNTNSISTPVRRPGRLPHKQIERKYREGLNLEIERLRKAVPTLLQSTDSCVVGAAKPSKGMVLAAAIRYILEIEEERDSAIQEIERLGGTFRVGKLNR